MHAIKGIKIVSSVNAAPTTIGPFNSTPIIPVRVSAAPPPSVPPSSVIPDGIILANIATVDNPTAVNGGTCDPLDTLHGDFLDDMEDDPNVDMFLDLYNIADVEMSTDSSKKK